MNNKFLSFGIYTDIQGGVGYYRCFLILREIIYNIASWPIDDGLYDKSVI